LIITLIIFILPVVVSTVLFKTGWRPAGTVNHGTLIVPPKQIADRELQTLDGKKINTAELKNKWTFFYFDSASCNESCINQLYFMRQTHLSLGKEYDRIQRVFVLLDDHHLEALKSRLAEYPQMIVLKLERGVATEMAHEFGADSEEGQGNIFLVDPQGFLMMRYKPGIDPAGTRKDMERLLKLSGDSR